MIFNSDSEKRNRHMNDREQSTFSIQYPYLSTSSHIHLTPDHAWLLYETQTNPHWNWGLNKLSHLEAEALFLCDGTRTVDEIENLLGKSWKNNASHSLASFIESMNFQNVITFSKKPLSFPAYPSNGGNRNFHVPLHVLFELTDNCNHYCKHCYRDSGQEKTNFINTRRLIELIESLSCSGTLVCELTGGEPLLHPDFEEVAASCAEHFEVVSIITNGFLINGELADFLGSLKYSGCQLLVSVTLNSFEENFHDRFAETSGSFERACEAINLLASNDILTRATMNIVPENVTHVEKTCELALSTGAEAFAAALIMPFGRGTNFLETHFSAEEIAIFEKSLKKLARKYPGQIITIPEAAFDFIEAPNCGAGSRSLVVSPEGNIRPCVTIPEQYSIGNILYQELEECLSNPLMSVFEKIKAPDEESCKDCSFFEFCHRCFWRAIIASHKKDHCSWKESCASEVLKTGLDESEFIQIHQDRS